MLKNRKTLTRPRPESLLTLLTKLKDHTPAPTREQRGFDYELHRFESLRPLR